MKTVPVDVACKSNPDLFFSDNPSHKTLAIDMCSSCPVQKACLQQARTNEERHGIWGGTDFSSVKYSSKKKSEDPNTRLGLCRNGLHPKNGPGSCRPCYREADRAYKKRYYQKLKAEGRLEEVVKAARERRKQKIGGMCHNKKHVLTADNTMIRGYDGALMCAECYRRVRPIVLSQEVRKKIRGYD